jgi:tRNA dimethylallyltransferase
MVKQGLIDEVTALLPYRQLNALNTVGYAELFDHFDGKTSLDEALLLIKQNTRRFAKRQLTWFRKDKDFIWFDAGAPDVIDQMIKTIETPA